MGSTAEYLILSGIIGTVMPIFTVGFGLDPVWVSWAISIPRILDAILDPFVGYISDRTQTRFGRRRPFLFLSALLATILSMAIWWADPSWSKTSQFSYLLIGNVGLGIAFAFYTIPLYALGYELTDDYAERTRIAAVRSVFCAIPGFLVYWIYWLALRPIFGGEVVGIRWVSAGVALMILAFGWMPVFCCRERLSAAARPKTSLWRGVADALRNRPFLYIIAIRGIFTIGAGLFTGLLFYINVYFVFRGEKDAATRIAGLFGMAATICGVVAPALISALSRRFGKRSLLIGGVGLHLATAVMGYFFIAPSTPHAQIALAGILSVAGALIGIFMNGSMPDICDLDEFNHGTRREGLFSSIVAFLSKVEISIVTLLVGYVLKAAGFDPALNLQSEHTIETIRFSAFVPYGLLVVAAVFFALRYPVTKEMVGRVQLQLASRRRDGLR
jgi:GPH family glycoside/pentoside/hexuronide:cation symporter